MMFRRKAGIVVSGKGSKRGICPHISLEEEMKRFWMVLLVGLASAFPLAFAQDAELEPFIGGGFSIAVPGGDASLSIQGGAGNLLGPLTLRTVLDIGFQGGAALFIDVFNTFPNDELVPYVGGGAGLGLSSQAYELHALGGLEYFVSDGFALFVELQPAFRIFPGSGNTFGANIRLGANYHFN